MTTTAIPRLELVPKLRESAAVEASFGNQHAALLEAAANEIENLRNALNAHNDAPDLYYKMERCVERRGDRFGIAIGKDEEARKWQEYDRQLDLIKAQAREALTP